MLKKYIYVHSKLQYLGCWNRVEKLTIFFLYNFHREHSMLKLEIKKLSPKINVKTYKNDFFLFFFFFGGGGGVLF